MNILLIKTAATTALLLTLGACSDSLPTAPPATGNKQQACEGYPQQNGDSVTVCEVREIADVATAGAPSVVSTNGDLSLLGGERSSISGTAFVYGRGATEERALAIAAGVTVVAADDDFRGEPPADLGQNESWGVGFDLSLPMQSNVSSTSTNGTTEAGFLQGDLHFNSINGAITLAGLAGSVNVDASNGDVDVILLGTEWGENGIYASATNGSVRYYAPDDYNGHFILQAQNGSASSEFEGGECSQGTTDAECDITLGAGGSELTADATNGNAELRRILQ